MIKDLQPNVIITTPSWAMQLTEEAKEQNFDFQCLQLKSLWLTGEGCSPAFRERLEKIWSNNSEFFLWFIRVWCTGK